MILPAAGIAMTTLVNGKVSEKKIKEIHDKVLTVDTHCDTPMNLLDENFDIGVKNKPPQSRVDFPRMKEGGLDAIFFAAFTGQKERTAENTESAYQAANQMIDATYNACSKYSEMAEIALTPSDATRLEKQGKRAIFIGMENGFPLGTDIKRVKEFYAKGVRYITLCHSLNNDICDSSSDIKGTEHGGLSKFGKEVVKEMNFFPAKRQTRLFEIFETWNKCRNIFSPIGINFSETSSQKLLFCKHNSFIINPVEETKCNHKPNISG